MNTLEAAPVAPVTSLKAILSTGKLPDDDQKKLLNTFLDSLESKMPTDVAIPAAPDITDNSAQGPPVDRLISMNEVIPIVGYSRRAILRMIEKGTFPAPIRMNSRCNRFRLSAVTAWVDAMEEKSIGAVFPEVCPKKVESETAA